MGKRQELLKSIITPIAGVKAQPKPEASSLLKSKYSGEIYTVYKNLGSQLVEPPMSFGAWDIPSDKIIFELDEERHFNRYREMTLSSPFYHNHKFFSVANYRSYCSKNEVNCLKTASWVGNWKNNSTEKLFLKSGDNGDLSKNGSSRWRQRAFYDFLKDISSNIIEVPIIRISIYDAYQGKKVDDLLKTRQINLLTDMVGEIINKYSSRDNY